MEEEMGYQLHISVPETLLLSGQVPQEMDSEIFL